MMTMMSNGADDEVAVRVAQWKGCVIMMVRRLVIVAALVLSSLMVSPTPASANPFRFPHQGIVRAKSIQKIRFLPDQPRLHLHTGKTVKVSRHEYSVCSIGEHFATCLFR